MSDHQVVRIRSGVLAMRSVAADEVMHPGVGPLEEAQRLYVRQSRLSVRIQEGGPAPLVVFDVGMGAGSNAAAAFNESARAAATARRLTLISFDRDLDALKTALTEPAAFGLDGLCGKAARELLRTGSYQGSRTAWLLEQGDAREALARQPQAADVIFWDPFSLRANPEMWTIAAFATAHRVAGPRCTLFTYSASTAVRVSLLLAGWVVGVGEGIGAKAATTAAAVAAQDVAQPLDRAWLRRLSRASVPLPIDAPLDAVARVAALPQFAITAPPAPGGTFPTPDWR